MHFILSMALQGSIASKFSTDHGKIRPEGVKIDLDLTLLIAKQSVSNPNHGGPFIQ